MAAATPLNQSASVPIGLLASARRILLVALILGGLVALTYGFAWFRASNLSSTYLADADASYEAGNYLDSLVGYDEFDEATNSYVTRGGYLQVERIWRDPYSWPIPPDVQRSRERIDEVINERLTIAEAEQFVRANIGRSNAYLGLIYLRLGELYEEDGDVGSAREVYEEVAQLYSSQEPELAARASAHLERLGSEE